MVAVYRHDAHKMNGQPHDYAPETFAGVPVNESRRDLREPEEKILEQRKVYWLQTVDHGQVVKDEDDRLVETAKSSILRVGTHSKYGFGEL